MPRKPDPALEQTIIDSALRLLDRRGLDALTMRDVAKAARTTTPTLYERFQDRDSIVLGVLDRVAFDLYDRLKGGRTLAAVGERFLQYCCEYPNRLDLLHKVWPATLTMNRRRPTYEMVLERLKKEHGHSPQKAEEVATALIAILLGAAVLMLGAGPKASYTTATRRASLKAFRVICEGM